MVGGGVMMSLCYGRQRLLGYGCPEATWLVWVFRLFFPDLPFLPSTVWVVLGAELGCFRAAGASFDLLPAASEAAGVLGSGLLYATGVDPIGVFFLDPLLVENGGAGEVGSGSLELLWCSTLAL
ncbi:hypothetical protein ACOSQ3_022430 [Xanthoceras sorbifolium]